MRSRRRMKTVPKYVSVGIRDWVQQTYLSIRVKGRVDTICEPKLAWIVDQFVKDRVDIDETHFDSI